MFFIFKSKIHLAAAFLVLATLIFILHQMLSSVEEPAAAPDTAFKLIQPQDLLQVRYSRFLEWEDKLSN